jgi:two-component system, sensor histidine kinase
MLNKKIPCLLVEDDSLAQLYATEILKRVGLKVTVASSAEEALALLENAKYNIIFTDIGLPGKNGIELAKEIRNTLRINTPIIALTTCSAEEKRAECFAAGMNDFITKPLTLVNLKTIISKYFN